MIYLDNAATSAIKPLSVHLRMFKESLFSSINAGRGGHRKSIAAIEKINNTADLICQLFNGEDSGTVAFMPNASYALNLALLGALTPDDHVVTTVMEHNSVLRPIIKTCKYTLVPADEDGFVNPDDIEKAIIPETKVIVCSHVSNVTGAIQPINAIGAIAKRYGIIFLLDAAQSAGCIEINAKESGADIIAFSGHKGLLGPLGTGGLYISPDVDLQPVITGGTGSLSKSLIQPNILPDKLQIGTLNTPAIIALGTAVRSLEDPSYTLARESELARKFIDDLLCMQNVELIGPYNKNRNGTVSFIIHGANPAEVENYLDREKGIIVRAGYHCAPLAHKNLGTDNGGTVRVSFGYFNSNYDRLTVTDAIYSFLKKQNI